MDKTQEAFYILIESLGVEVLEREGIHGISVNEVNIKEVMGNVYSVQSNLVRMVLGLAIGGEDEGKSFLESARIRKLLHDMVDKEYIKFMTELADDKFIVIKDDKNKAQKDGS